MMLRPNTAFYGNYFVRNAPANASSGFAFETTSQNWLTVAKKDSLTFEPEIQNGFIKVRASFPTSETERDYKIGWLDMETVRLAIYGDVDEGAGGNNDGEFSAFQKAGLITVPFSWWWFLLLIPAYLFYKWLRK